MCLFWGKYKLRIEGLADKWYKLTGSTKISLLKMARVNHNVDFLRV